MEQNKAAKGFLIGSIVSLAFTGLSVLCVILMGFLLLLPGSGGSSTAITNEAVLGIAGMMVLVVCAWITGGIGTLTGIIMLIIGLVKKCFNRIWMPIVSLVLCLIPFLGPIIFLALVSA